MGESKHRRVHHGERQVEGSIEPAEPRYPDSGVNIGVYLRSSESKVSGGQVCDALLCQHTANHCKRNRNCDIAPLEERRILRQPCLPDARQAHPKR
jgi:hypothetical protein